jgi:prepilin-type processing-associated H-X9-DG protein
VENGAATPGNMPDLGPDDNHGANFRNVLYLDGHVAAHESADAANAIFDGLKAPNILQSVD